MRILIADDDRETVDLLTYWLRGHGYEILRAFDGEQALALWREGHPDLVILDLQMPKVPGFEVCRRITADSATRVLILTASDREQDEIQGLELGADDYLRKPFSPRQLLARIRVLARRAATHGAAEQGGSRTTITVGPITLDTTRHEVTHGDSTVRLTPIEHKLLHLLLTHSGQVLPTDTLVKRVWGYEDTNDSSLVKAHIHHLRQKIEPELHAPRYILTVPGVGYTFKPPTTTEPHRDE